jgi:lipoprotein-anchoring transpeptidase ErfK/SrfK
MRFTRSLLFIAIGGIASLITLNISLKKVATPKVPQGCSGTVSTADQPETVAIWNNQFVSPLLAIQGSLTAQDIKILGTHTTSSDKWIEVDLTHQRLTAHDGNDIFLEAPISSGLTNPTPTGVYHIWYKALSLKMEGGSKSNNTYYYLPNVPYDMFFSGDYGIHGTYWHSNFGFRMSHGCVNTATPIAEKLFYWTDPQLPDGKREVKATPQNPGTRIVIHD